MVMLQTTEAQNSSGESFADIKTAQIQAQTDRENYRQPTEGEPKIIRLDRVLIAPKLSKLEYDMQRLGLGESAVVERYRAEGARAEQILESHVQQRETLHTLRRIFAAEQFLARNQVTTTALREADLVIAVGGDNHFQYVSHAVEDGLILGINSDPLRSEGALVQYRVEQLSDLLAALAQGAFEICEWTRLEGEVDGRPLPRILCEYFLGEREQMDMSRYTLHLRDFREEQKGSGVLVSTGAGSSGWYDSEITDFLGRPDIFPRSQPEARLFVRAPFRGRLTSPKLRHQSLLPGESLSISSLNDADGVIGCDALERIPFPRGALARIKISDTPLKVVRALL